MPQKYAENPQLGDWVIHQRADFRNGKMSEQRIAKLNELDFAWNGKTGSRKSLSSGICADGYDEHETNGDE